MFDLTGKTAVVTGGSRGIGRAICLKLAGQGANIVLNFAGNEAAAQETRSQCEALGVKALAVKGDVADAEACNALIEKAVSEFGGVDILVCNAGVTRDNLLMRMSDEEFQKVIDTNLKGTFHCMRAAIRPMMKKRRGRIISISSVVGLMGNAGQINYAASKAGVIGMTKSAGPGGCQPAHHCQCCGAGLHQDRYDRRSQRQRQGGNPPWHSAGRTGRGRGCSQCGAVSGIGRGSLHHRTGYQRGRRHGNVTPLPER